MSEDEVLIAELRKIGGRACDAVADELERFVMDPQAYRQRVMDCVRRGVVRGPEDGEDEDEYLRRFIDNCRYIARDLIRMERR